MMWPSLNETEKEMDADDDLFEGGPKRCLYNFFCGSGLQLAIVVI